MVLNSLINFLVNAFVFLTFWISTFDYSWNSHTAIDEEKVDFIVVGAGSAGSIVAGRLSQNTDYDVYLLDAGNRPEPSFYVPGLFALVFIGATESLRQFSIVPPAEGIATMLRENTGQFYPRGWTVGGSSSINGGKMLRGSKQDFDNWASLGNTGWGYNDVLPFFKMFETYDGPTDEETAQYRGSSGPITMKANKERNDFQKIAIEAANQVGLEVVDQNAKNQIGIGIFQGRIKDGERVTSTDGYIRPYIQGKNKRNNLKLLINSQVTEILFNDTSAIGVKLKQNGEEKTLYARKEVIVSAGALESPKLLMLSGIGPTEELNKHKITVRKDLPVGKNFQDHISVNSFLTWYSGSIRTISAFELLNPFNVIKYLFRKGMYSSFWGQETDILLNMDLMEDGDTEWPDVHIDIVSTHYYKSGSLAYEELGYDIEKVEEYFSALENTEIFTMSPQVTRPYSRGVLTLSETDPINGQPVVDPKIMDDIRDVYILANATKFIIETYAQAEAFTDRGVTFYDKTVPGCDGLSKNSDEYYQCVAKAMVFLTYHPCGTCKMAPDGNADGVVNPQLKVQGYDNLRVIDASIMPEIVTTNLDCTTYMIGERGAQLIIDEWTSGNC